MSPRRCRSSPAGLRRIQLAHHMRRIALTALLFTAVLWGGFFIAATNALTDDLELDW